MAKEKAKHDGLLCFLLALIVVLILVIGGGAYYFLVVDNGEEIAENKVQEETSKINYVGEWSVQKALKNNKEVYLSEIYGSSISYGTGKLTLKQDGTFTDYIRPVTTSEISDKGTYEIGQNAIILKYDDNRRKELKYKEIENVLEYPEYDDTTIILSKNTNSNISEITNNDKKVKDSLMPSGFSGSSLIKVVLYSDKTVYVVNYDGAGYEENNIASKTLIAKNAEKIEYNGQGENFKSIIIQGDNVEIINKSYNWIEFNNKNKTEDKAENKIDNKYTEITKEFEELDGLFITDIIDNKNDTYTLKGVKYSEYVEDNGKLKEAVRKGTYIVGDVEYKIKQQEDNTKYELVNNDGIVCYEFVNINKNKSALIVRGREIFTDCRKLTNEYFEITLSAKTVYRPRNSVLAADPEMVELETVKELYNSFTKKAPIETTHPEDIYGFEFENNKCVEIYYIPTGL